MARKFLSHALVGFVATMILLASELALAGKPTNPPLPNIRYRIQYVSLPENAGPDYLTPNSMSNGVLVGGQWKVRVVGTYNDSAGVPKAFLYDPIKGDSNRGSDLNRQFFDINGVPVDVATIPASCPLGYWLASACDVSDRGIVVGNLQDNLGHRRGFAVDLRLSPFVLDVLPDFGSIDARVSRINEGGDILIKCKYETGEYRAYIFNPGYYGDSGTPPSRLPIDFDDPAYSELAIELPVGYEPGFFFLNDSYEILPGVVRPPQIACTTDSGKLFRYTLGTTVIDTLGPPATAVSALKNDGTLCGIATVKGKSVTMRGYDGPSGIVYELLSTSYADTYPHDMNHSRDLLTRRTVYRDDWGWLTLDSLIVGTSADISLWKSDTRGYLLWPYLTDRIDVLKNDGSVVGRAGIIAGGRNNKLVIMNPVSAQ